MELNTFGFIGLGHTFLGGCADRKHLEFFLQKPNGESWAASLTFAGMFILRIFFANIVIF